MTKLAMMVFVFGMMAVAGDTTTEEPAGEQPKQDGVRIECKSNVGTSVSGTLKIFKDTKGRPAIVAQDLEFNIPKKLSFVPLKFKADMIGLLDSRTKATLFLDPKTKIKHKKGSGKVDPELRLTIRIDSKSPSIIQNANIEAPIVYCDCQLMEEYQVFRLTSR